jgi:hypothetical protein
MLLGDSSIIALYRRLIIAVTCLANGWDIPVASEDFENSSFRLDAMASQKTKTSAALVHEASSDQRERTRGPTIAIY